jgi:hypothetical protein
VRQDQAVRIYVPATLDLTIAWRTTGVVPADSAAYAVTQAVIDAVDGDDEEQEFAASAIAADESLVLLAGSSAVRRRVVLALDAEATVGEGAEVALAADVPWQDVAAVLIDDARAVPAVIAALADATPESLDELALLWFSADELDELIASS